VCVCVYVCVRSMLKLFFVEYCITVYMSHMMQITGESFDCINDMELNS